MSSLLLGLLCGQASPSASPAPVIPNHKSLCFLWPCPKGAREQGRTGSVGVIEARAVGVETAVADGVPNPLGEEQAAIPKTVRVTAARLRHRADAALWPRAERRGLQHRRITRSCAVGSGSTDPLRAAAGRPFRSNRPAEHLERELRRPSLFPFAQRWSGAVEVDVDASV